MSTAIQRLQALMDEADESDESYPALSIPKSLILELLAAPPGPREPTPDSERLDWLDVQRRRTYTRPPLRMVSGTEWAIHIEHQMPGPGIDAPDLREAIDAARLRDESPEPGPRAGSEGGS